MIISLTGFMGSGKTSVGRKLSTLLSYAFVDLDDYIVKTVGREIKDIFASEGEAAFRKIECECLGKVLDEYEQSGESLILSLGGGAVMTPACLEMIQNRTTCFYLKGTPETLRSHLGGDQSGRPMLQGNKLESLLELRDPTYETAAHHIICIDGRTVPTIARRIASLL